MNNYFADKKILVTGGAGFIGSHLVEKLVALKSQVWVIDNLSTGSRDNIASVINDIHFIEADITNMDIYAQLPPLVDIIFHLAAQTSVPESFENHEHCFKTNIIGTTALLMYAAKISCLRFIFSSSAAVYGAEEEICAETNVCKPTSPYGSSKLIGEQLCSYFYKTFQLPAVSLRYFNVYGPGQNPHHPYAGVCARFYKAMECNESITVFGDGTQTRDFVHVSEVINANLSAASAPTSLVAGQIFNVATGVSISLLELIDALKKEFPHYNAQIYFETPRKGDIHHSEAQCTKYQSLKNHSFF